VRARIIDIVRDNRNFTQLNAAVGMVGDDPDFDRHTSREVLDGWGTTDRWGSRRATHLGACRGLGETRMTLLGGHID